MLIAMSLGRSFKHFYHSFQPVFKTFPEESLERITQAINESEKSHDAELVFAVESSLSALAAYKGLTAQQRSFEVFSQLKVWDTEKNNGVLIYLLLADRDIEIVLDRGIYSITKPEQWEDICQQMEAKFRKGLFEEGVVEGIQSISAILKLHFPKTAGDRNEIPNRPVIL
jgi:uncharacterized membrane protein